MKPRQVQKLLMIDFEKFSSVLMNETHHGQVNLDICEGLEKVDPFILNYSPVFFQYTIWGHIYCAMMYAIKLFDDHGNAYTVPKFLAMTRLRVAEFPKGSDEEVLQLVVEADAEIAKLKQTIKELRRRRNQMLAHISEQLVLRDEKFQRETVLTIEQVRRVLRVAGKIVNSLTLKWGNFMCASYSHTDDYMKVISIVNKYLCEQARRHDEEYAKYGSGMTIPDYARPRDCPGVPSSKQKDPAV
jgi:AbiU2